MHSSNLCACIAINSYQSLSTTYSLINSFNPSLSQAFKLAECTLNMTQLFSCFLWSCSLKLPLQAYRETYDLYDISMISLWYLYDISMISLWYLYDISMISLWYLYDISMISLWYLYDISMFHHIFFGCHGSFTDLYWKLSADSAAERLREIDAPTDVFRCSWPFMQLGKISFIWLLVTRCHTFALLNAWVFPTPDDKHESEIIMFVFRPFSVFSKSFGFATDCDTILCSANMFHRVFLGSRIWQMQFQGCVVFYTMHCFVHPGSNAPQLGCKAPRLS